MVENVLLKRNVAGLWAGVFQSLAYVAPAAVAASFFVVEASVAGAAVPLTFLLAIIGVASAMYMNYEFSKRISHAGGYYAYVSAGLGPRFGAFSAWLYWVNVLGALVGFSVLFFAGVLQPLVPGLAGNTYGWIPLAFIPIAIIFLLLYFGLKPSLYYTLIGSLIEVSFLIIVSIVIITSPQTTNSFAPFTTEGVSASQLGLATVYAILGFVGLGSVITLSEELGRPKRTVPKAIILALVIGAVVYVLSSYAFVVGWGLNDINGFASATNPGFIIVNKYLGPIAMSIFIIITLNSFISNGIAEGNAFTRLGFAMSRDRILLNRRLATVDPRTGAPKRIVIFSFAITTALSLIAGLLLKDPFLAATVVTTVNGASLYIVHILANISLPVYGHRKLRVLKKWLPFALGPVIATIVYAYALFGVFTAPLNGVDALIMIIVIVVVVIGIILASLIHIGKTREEMETIGREIEA